MFEEGFKSYIQKRIISELSFKLKWYTTSEFITLDLAEKNLSFLKELNKNGAIEKRKVVDKVAASIILQTYLDMKK